MNRTQLTLLVPLLFFLFACANSSEPTPSSPTTEIVEIIVPTDTPVVDDGVTPTPVPQIFEDADFITLAMDVPDRSGQFADFDQFGDVRGLDADMLSAISEIAGLEYELIVTRFDGMLESVARGEFSAAMSRILISAESPPGITFTDPYLEYGQVLMVRANETEIEGWADLSGDSAETLVAVVANSPGEATARNQLGLPDEQIVVAASTADVLQLVSDFGARAAIVNSFDGESYAERYYQRLRLVGQDSAEYWLNPQQYGIAVASGNQALLDRLNVAIFEAKAQGIADTATAQWLISNQAIVAGDSLIGTPPDRLLIGVVGNEINLDPADNNFSLVEWEIMQNTLSGLVGYDADNNLVPVLAQELPVISAENTEYTFTLRENLTFPDDSVLDANAVKLSLQRVAATANPILNVLKDSNLDGFADPDAIQVIDPRTIRFLLDTADSTFLSRLATPPFAIIGPRCASGDFDPTLSCAGIAPYVLDMVEPGVAVRLSANLRWPFDAPVMEKVEVRLYNNSTNLSNALGDGAIDIAWHGLAEDDDAELRTRSAISSWQGPGMFKSYLVFEQGEESPWEDVRLRQAAALAVDREAIATAVFGGTRLPLYSPIPDGIPGQISAEPQRNLDEAISLLQSAGYSSANQLEINLYYLNDGRYTDLEQQYAEAIEAQMEETGIFDVTLTGEGWAVYSGQMSSCNYETFLLGWPPATRPPYLDGLNWIAHFVYNAASVCSNYDSEEMVALLDRLYETVEPAARMALYEQIQALWAQEYPTLDLYQQTRDALSLSKVSEIEISGLGLMHYDRIVKSAE